MLYARVSTDGTILMFPVTEDDLRAVLQHIVLPERITPQVLEGTGFVQVPLYKDDVIPQNTKDKMVDLVDAYVDAAGNYRRRYVLVDVPEYQKRSRLAAKWAAVRKDRNRRMNVAQWRIWRWERETRLGLEPTDDIKKLDTYMQALADITKIDDPFLIEWPTLE